VALEYASLYGDFEGSMALNPSHTDITSLKYTVGFHEDTDAMKRHGMDIKYKVKPWSAHAEYTHEYQAIQKPSLVPCLVMIGTEDVSYPKESYIPNYTHWVSQSAKRQLFIYEGPHNGWAKPFEPRPLKGNVSEEDQARFNARRERYLRDLKVFPAVVGKMAEFITTITKSK
jgi:hypothetical protein